MEVHLSFIHRFKPGTQPGARQLLLNLSDLTQIDSTGVSAIVRTYVRLRSQGGDLKLLRPRGHAKTVLGMLHLLQLMASFEEEEQALESFRQPIKFPGA